MKHVFERSLSLVILASSTFIAANAQSVQTSIPLSGVPGQAAVNLVTNKIYVAVPSNSTTPDTVEVINGKTNSAEKTITLSGNNGYAVAVDSIRNRVYVGGCYPDSNGNTLCEVSTIDGSKDSLLNTILVTNTPGFGIQGVAVNLATGSVYVSNASDDVVDVINYKSTAVNTTISLGGQSPAGLTANPFNNTLYVALATNLVDVISTKTNAITTTTTVGQVNQGVAVNWNTGNVFVTNNVFSISTTGVLNASGAVVANVTVGNTPFGVDVDPVTNLAFVTNTEDGTLSIINGANNTVSSTLSASGTFVAVNPVTEKVYVSGAGAELIVVSEK